MPVALLGYSPVFGIFTAWQAELHHESAYSKNLQFKESLLEAAVDRGWAVDDLRRTDSGPEVRVAVHPLHLHHYLAVMRDADTAHVSGEQRKAYFETRSPRSALLPDAEQMELLPPLERKRVISERLQRDAKFAALVRAAFDEMCAVCGVQLNLVEAAHVIPVHDPMSRDEIWNGIALCRNHHRLFDQRILRIAPEGNVSCPKEEVDFLRQTGRLGGFGECLKPYLDTAIRFPRYWNSNRPHRVKFQDALSIRFIA
jgi:putative restriction endonuclease